MRIDLGHHFTQPHHLPGMHRPGPQLLSAVMRLAAGRAELLRHAERSWASATFAGTHHMVALTFAGADAMAAAEAFIEALPDHEFAIPGQLVADAAIASIVQDAERLTVEAELLLLEDA
ncbi:MAG TPA: hypothetical protein VGE05_04600 [Novosphingobium sp.]